jgi:hypothetical protein
MVIVELAAGILPGVVIVFSGVWIALYWNAAGDSRKRALSIAMATSLIVVLIGFLRIASLALIIAVVATLLVTIVYALFWGSNRDGRSLSTHRPDTLAKSLYKPLAVFFGAAAILSTVALFATMQQGPMANLPIFELSALAAACWALMMVGGVWAKKHMPVARPTTRRRDDANRREQRPFRKFPG